MLLERIGHNAGTELIPSPSLLHGNNKFCRSTSEGWPMWSTYLLSIRNLYRQLRQPRASIAALFPDIRPLHCSTVAGSSLVYRVQEYIMSVLGRRGACELRALATCSSPYTASSLRPFSILNRPQPSYPGHVPLTTIERGALAVGSAIGSLINPRRAGMLTPSQLRTRISMVIFVPWAAPDSPTSTNHRIKLISPLQT